MNETMLIAMLLLAVLLFMAIMVGVLAMAARQMSRSRILKRLIDPYGAVVGRPVGVEKDGMAFTLALEGKRKALPLQMTLSVEFPTEAAFTVTREGAMERLFKRLRISEEIQTGDPDFDRACYLATPRPRFTEAYFRSAEKRRSVMGLMAQGFREVRLKDSRLTAVLRVRELAGNPAPALVADALDCLGRLLTEIPTGIQEAIQPAGAGVRQKQAVIFGGIGTVMLAGMVATIWADAFCWPLSPLRLFGDSLKFSLGPMILFMALAVWALKGRATSHWEIVAAVSLALIGFPLAGFGLGAAANGELDTAPIQTHSVRVVQKYTRTHKTSTTHIAAAESWRIAGRTEAIAFPADAWDRITPGRTTLTCDTRPGRLGFEWLLGCNIDAD